MLFKSSSMKKSPLFLFEANLCVVPRLSYNTDAQSRLRDKYQHQNKILPDLCIYLNALIDEN